MRLLKGLSSYFINPNTKKIYIYIDQRLFFSPQTPFFSFLSHFSPLFAHKSLLCSICARWFDDYGSTIVVMRHNGDVDLIWWVSGSVLVGLGCLYWRCLGDDGVAGLG